MSRIIVLILSMMLGLLLQACGGGGSSSSGGADMPDVRPEGTIEGRVFLDAVRHATVVAYDFTNGTKGPELGRGTTSDNGDYSFRVRSDDVDLLVEVSGGSYVEESTGVTVPLGSTVIRAVSRYVSGALHNINITHFTNVACGYANYLMTQGETATSAISNANTRYSELLGFDILKTTPLSITDTSNASPVLNDGLRYGLLHAGISKVMENISSQNGSQTHILYTSALYTSVAYDDIQDGVLDGRGKGDQLSFGLVNVSVENYRNDLSVSMFAVVNDGVSVVGLSGSDISVFAQRINDSVDPIFSGEPPMDLDGDGPVITSFNLTEGATIFGNAPLQVVATDSTGIDTIVVDFGGISSVHLLSGHTSYFDTATSTTPDAEYQVTVIATNNLGTSASLTRHIRIINMTGDVTGKVMSPPLISSTVKIYAYTGMTKGVLLGTGTTDSNGEYSIPLRTFAVPILVEAKGGSYTEPASGINITLSDEQSFSAVDEYAGADKTIIVSPFTTFAHARAKYLAWLGVDDITAISAANGQFNNITGVNITTIFPADPDDSNSYTFTLTNNHKYGLLIAGISQWTLDETIRLNLPQHQVYNTVEFTRSGYEDILADGEYGEAGSAAIMLGSTELNEETYRHELAVDAIQFVNGNHNATGLNASAVYTYFNTYNNNQDPIYGGIATTPLNEGNPSILGYTPGDGESRNKTFKISATVKDLIGITTGQLFMDGAKVQDFVVNVDQIQSVTSSAIDTIAPGDGIHAFSMVFRNAVGDEVTTGDINIAFDNTPPQFWTCQGSNASMASLANGASCIENNWNSSTRTCTQLFQFSKDELLNTTLDGVQGEYLGSYSDCNVGGACPKDLYRYRIQMGINSCKKVVFTAEDQAGNEFIMTPRLNFAPPTNTTDGNRIHYIYVDGDHCERTIPQYVGSVSACNGL